MYSCTAASVMHTNLNVYYTFNQIAPGPGTGGGRTNKEARTHELQYQSLKHLLGLRGVKLQEAAKPLSTE